MEEKKTNQDATVAEPSGTETQWGSMAQDKTPSKEQIDEQKRLQMLQYCAYNLKTNKDLTPIQRRGL